MSTQPVEVAPETPTPTEDVPVFTEEEWLQLQVGDVVEPRNSPGEIYEVCEVIRPRAYRTRRSNEPTTRCLAMTSDAWRPAGHTLERLRTAPNPAVEVPPETPTPTELRVGQVWRDRGGRERRITHVAGNGLFCASYNDNPRFGEWNLKEILVNRWTLVSDVPEPVVDVPDDEPEPLPVPRVLMSHNNWRIVLIDDQSFKVEFVGVDAMGGDRWVDRATSPSERDEIFRIALVSLAKARGDLMAGHEAKAKGEVL